MKGEKRWAWPVVAAVFGLTLFFGAALRDIKVEGGTVFLPPEHPVERAIAGMERVFGSSEIISVLMHQDRETVFTPDTLRLISRITAEIEALPGVDKVDSLSNTDYMSGGDGQITVEKLMPKEPASAADAALVRERALSWDMYKGAIVSEDSKSVQWIVTLENDAGKGGNYTPVVEAVQQILSRYAAPQRHFMVTGEVAVKAMLVTGITRDLTILLPILVVVLIAILFFAFRRPGGVVLPLATVVISTIWTVGLMSVFGVPINIMGTAIPLLLVTVGSAYGIHFLSHYYVEAAARDEGALAQSVLEDTIRKVGLPILLAGITTIAGFGSLGSATVPAILDMGIFTAVGVLCALVLTFTFVPAVLLLTPNRARTGRTAASQHSHEGRHRTVRLLTGIYDTFAGRPLLLGLLVLVLVGLSVVGITRIQIGQPTVDFFRPGSPVRQAARFADRDFGGSTVMYAIVSPERKSSTGGSAAQSADDPATATTAPAPAATVPQGDAGVEAAFESFGDLSKMDIAATGAQSTPGTQPGAGLARVTDPAVLQAVDGLERNLLAPGTGVGSARSLTTMIKQMNRVMHDGNDSFYEIPSDPAKYRLADSAGLRRLIAQYLLLYSGNLSSFVDSTDNPSELRIAIQLTDGSPQNIGSVKQRIESYANAHLAPLGFRVETVGLPDEMLAMNSSIMHSQFVSLSLALIFVFIAITIAYRSLRVGLAGLVPILLSLILNFGTMGFLHIPLDIVTAMIASVAVGIGIDYSIHVVSAYVRQYGVTGDTEEAAHRTLGLTGRAIFFNVSSVTVGFAVLVFSMFTPLNSLGILIGVIMITSSFFALTLLPVILRVIVPRTAVRARTSGTT